MRDDVRGLCLHAECATRERAQLACAGVEGFVEVAADDTPVPVAVETECPQPAEAHGRALCRGDVGARGRGEDAGDVRGAAGLRGQGDEEAFQEVRGDGLEDAVHGLVVVVAEEPRAREGEDGGEAAVGGVGPVGGEEAVQDHADQVGSTGVGGAEFDDGAEEVVQIHFAPRVPADGEAGGLAVAENLVVEELGFFGVLGGGLG